MALATVIANGAEPPELIELRKKFEDAQEKANAPINQLVLNYIGALDKLKSEAQATGDLDQVLAINKEAASINGERGEIDERFKDLVNAKNVYEDSLTTLSEMVDRSIGRLNEAYLQQLDTLQKNLTKQGRLNDAIQVKSVAETVSAAPSAKPKGDLIGHWKFDTDGSDFSGFGRHAIVFGGAKIVQGRIGEGALKVGQGQFAEVPHHPDFDLKGQFTISSWVRLDEGVTQDKWAPIATKAIGSWRLHIGPESNQVALHLNTNVGRLTAQSKAKALSDGKWYHLASSFDGKNLILYVDGRKVGEHLNDHALDVNTHDQSVRFGGNVSNENFKFRGVIDDVRIYRKALDESDIKRLASGAGLIGE